MTKQERIEQLELIESTFDAYRKATTTALGIDPRSCIDDVKDAIAELKDTNKMLREMTSTRR